MSVLPSLEVLTVPIRALLGAWYLLVVRRYPRKPPLKLCTRKHACVAVVLSDYHYTSEHVRNGRPSAAVKPHVNCFPGYPVTRLPPASCCSPIEGRRSASVSPIPEARCPLLGTMRVSGECRGGDFACAQGYTKTTPIARSILSRCVRPCGKTRRFNIPNISPSQGCGGVFVQA